MLMTLAEIRALVETDLTDGALTTLAEDAEAAIVDRFGPHDTVEVTLPGGTASLALPRPADTSLAVTVDETRDGVTTILAADDWRADHRGRTLVRLNTGTNPYTRWAPLVGLAYTPTGVARRKRVFVDLIRLAAGYRGLSSETAGDWQVSFPEYQRERERLLAEVDDGPVFA